MLDSYAELHALSRHIALLNATQEQLSWDQETYMPPAAIKLRADQLEQLASLIHKARSSPKFFRALNQLIDVASGEILDESLSEERISALREWRRDYQQMIRLPHSFVKSLARVTAEALPVWGEAKRHNDFSLFAPHLEAIVKLMQKKANYLGYEEHPYDALVDLYEPGMRVSKLDPLFTRLKLSLSQLLKAIGSKPKIDETPLHGEVSSEKEMEFGRKLLQAIGLDEAVSRLDKSEHPFCSGSHPKDIRMTTRLMPERPLSNIFAVLHEGGHGLYVMGLKEGEFGSPLGEAASLGVHESQSRFWETFIGHSLPFWKQWYPELQKGFPETFKKVAFNDFYRAINRVSPSLIRIESDEATYSLHVIVRYEIEKALIEGSLKVKDLPEAWNEKMRSTLGIEPTNYRDGCLQDIHWAMGGFGYFPTYTLGNIYAAELFCAFKKAHPDWEKRVSSGELGFIREFLYNTIHKYGRQFIPEQLIERATGSRLSEEPYLSYLQEKFTQIYQL